MLNTLLPTLINFGGKTVTVLFALWLSFKVAGWASRAFTNTLRRKSFHETLTVFFGNMLRWVIILAGVLACLSIFGIETTSFAAIIGTAGLAIGLAFQGALGNFASGVLLLTFRPFRVGDVITAAGATGEVTEIGLFVCVLGTADGRTVIVPNNAVGSASIENLTELNGGQGQRRVDINVGTEYSADINATRAALEKAAAAVTGRHADLGHQIMLLGLGGSSVDWQVRVCAMPPATGMSGRTPSFR